MINIFNRSLLSLVCFILCAGLMTSCEKDKDATSSAVELLSFGPTGAKHGDTLRFIGNNLDKVVSVELTGASVVKSEFLSQSSETILIRVPDQALQGFVKLKTDNSEIVSKSQLNLNVLSQITSFTAEARPGQEITINGKYLEWVDRITFFNNKRVDTFVSKSFNKIVVKVPADAQTGKLIFSVGGTEPAEIESATALTVTLPVATSLSPNPVKHAGDLTIAGTNLDLVKSIAFTGVSTPVTSFVSQSPTQIVVKVPGATTKGKLTFTVASGVKVETSELDVVLPAVTSMSPNPVDPDANVTITGTNLDLVSSVAFVGVNNAVTSFVSQTPTQLVVKVPVGSITGKITLAVKNSVLSVKSGTDLAIVGSSVPPIIIYDDVLTSAWNGWTGGGWGGAKDVNNTSPVRSGSKSVKIDYTSGGYGVPWQLGGANISLGGYTSLKVSIYGGTGSNGKSVNIGFNEQDGKTVNIVEGQWTDFTIPLSQISSASTLTHLYMKNYSASGDFTIYVDNLGLY